MAFPVPWIWRRARGRIRARYYTTTPAVEQLMHIMMIITELHAPCSVSAWWSYRNLAIQLPVVIEICEPYHKPSKPIENSHLADVLDECTRHVRDLNGLLGKLLPKDGDSLAVKGWKAAKSIALDKKVEQCSQKLETFKTLLSLELGLMTYEATVKDNGNNNKPQIEIAQHHHHLPTGRVGRFLGRGEFLSRIDDALTPAGSSAPKVCVLLGLGGQ